ncbi:RNA polymerase sigma factor [Aureliella helgolandensis]|nr:sigma-70 family RNA polymerase sigma factor [Aureliella helgolandensis]
MTAPDRLSQIETLWSMVYHAHDGVDLERQSAQRELLTRYGTAIQRYLRGAFRDRNAADDAYQEFAVKFLRGDFRNAHEQKGRFRGFLKTVLERLVADHYRKLTRKPAVQLDLEAFEPAAATSVEGPDCEFQTVWRDEMLSRSWRLLAEEEDVSGKPWMTVLRMRVENPQLRSAELAEKLGNVLGEVVTSTRLRVILHRARERFAKHLIQSIADTLSSDSLDEIETELADLELLQYCHAAIDRMRTPAS